MLLINNPFTSERLAGYATQLVSLVVLYLPRLAVAVLVLVVGWWLIGWASRLVAVATERLDVSLRSFLTSMFSIAFKVLLLISVAGMVGLQTTSFVAILGAAGLAVGLALQGTLANFAGGVLILVFKPFVVGDAIEAQGKSGVVQAIQIFNTLLLTPHGDTVILPNGSTSNGVIVNKSSGKHALVEIQVDVDASTDVAALRARALPVLRADPQVLAAPAPAVDVVAIKAGTTTLAFRAHTLPGQDGEASSRLLEKLQPVIFPPKPAAA
ncbi:mechanosensitive ion channel family protein [Hymenobacter nivis]|uniref:Mechanosensitive ion channel family protein n=1 Tax=Hymenobacter nivis TaxID=1850093 RepID=A0A502HFD1_9BACT|nr:mechanosensitive ion channel domain-containing protein [Hymenobacter nivis]TPG72283.1 mechanosensitive ion channel family protein [Hymenobacter nivis]